MFICTQILFNILFFAAVFAANQNYNISGTVLCYDGRTEQFYPVADIAVQLWNRDCSALVIHDDKKVGEALSWTDGHFEFSGIFGQDVAWAYLYIEHRCIPNGRIEKTTIYLEKMTFAPVQTVIIRLGGGESTKGNGEPLPTDYSCK